MPTQDFDKLYTTKEAARFLRISHRTLEDWRLRGCGPCYRKIGRRSVRYLEADLLAHRDQHIFMNTGQSRFFDSKAQAESVASNMLP